MGDGYMFSFVLLLLLFFFFWGVFKPKKETILLSLVLAGGRYYRDLTLYLINQLFFSLFFTKLIEKLFL